MSDSVGLLNSATVRVICNAEVNITGNASTSYVNCEGSSVQDDSSINCSISNADLTDNFPDVSPVTDMEAIATAAAVSGSQDTSFRESQLLEAAVTDTQYNSFMEGQQLQAAMEHIVMLTEQSKSLHTQCCQLGAANAELFQRSMALQQECYKLNVKNMELKTSICQALITIREEAFGYTNIEAHDEKTCHYTGLPAYSVFTTLFDLLKPFVLRLSSKSQAAATEETTAKNQFYATLVKLRHNVPMNDLAFRLHVTEATVSKFFHKWLDVMHCNLKQLIVWPDSETLQQNLPSVFHTNFTKVKCIIDCFEIFIERPVAFTARAATYSNYKKHNTVKVFIGISPTGAITFVSSAWGGRVSDKVITQQSGFLKHIDPGDIILADRGFNVHDDIAIRGGKLEIPAFTKGKKQLS